MWPLAAGPTRSARLMVGRIRTWSTSSSAASSKGGARWWMPVPRRRGARRASAPMIPRCCRGPRLTSRTSLDEAAMTTVVLLGSLDTKGEEFGYARDCIRELGASTILIDTGTIGAPTVAPDVTASEVAEAGGASLADLRAAGD